MRVQFISMTVLVPLLIVGASCAPATTGGGGVTAAPGEISGAVVRVDTPAPSALVFAKATVDDVWKVLPATFASLRIPAGIINEANRVFGNPKVIVSSVARQPVKELFRCGVESGLAISDYRVEFGITVQPRALVKGGTELNVQMTALGRLVSGSRTGTTHCVTNGLLEQKLHRQLQVELEKIGK